MAGEKLNLKKKLEIGAGHKKESCHIAHDENVFRTLCPSIRITPLCMISNGAAPQNFGCRRGGKDAPLRCPLHIPGNIFTKTAELCDCVSTEYKIKMFNPKRYFRFGKQEQTVLDLRPFAVYRLPRKLHIFFEVDRKKMAQNCHASVQKKSQSLSFQRGDVRK